MCLAYLDAFADRSQAVLQYHGYRTILSRARSMWLFRLLQNPSATFRRDFVIGMLRSLVDRPQSGFNKLYLNVGHTGLDQNGLIEWVKRTGVRPVYFVHDLIPITHPQFCRPGERDKHRRRMLTVVDTAVGVIGNSQATLDALAEFAKQEGRQIPRSIPGWLGTDVPPIETRESSDEPFFVALGTIEARKNHMMLLDVWSKIAGNAEGQSPRLLFIGQRGWECDDVFDRLANDASLRGMVTELNACSDEEMLDYLADARALLFPSFAEGFGLPITEALAVGTPVIASDLPVFDEIGQGVPDRIPADDVDAWRAAVLDYAKSGSARRNEQLERLKNFRPFSWHDHFAAIGPWLAKL